MDFFSSFFAKGGWSKAFDCLISSWHAHLDSYLASSFFFFFFFLGGGGAVVKTQQKRSIVDILSMCEYSNAVTPICWELYRKGLDIENHRRSVKSN
jgi:hypothetical protein